MVRWTILSSSTVTPEGPLPSIPFWDVGPLHRLSSRLQPIRELCEMLLQMLPVAVPGARCRSLRTCVRDLATMPLVEGFTGTMGQSDFPRPFIAGIPSTGSLCGPSRHRPGPDAGPPGFRTRCLGACTGSPTAQGPDATRDIAAPDVAFARPLEWFMAFRGSKLDLHLPCQRFASAIARNDA